MPSTSAFQWYEFGLVKADEQADEAAPWLIYIKASTPRVDFENERIPQRALKQAADYFLENGKITWEHLDQQHRHDASVIIGEPMAVEFPADGSTLVQARLYPLQDQARHVYNILRSGGRLKASVGGSCAKRPGRDGVTDIPQIWWSHLALTPFPVNNDTSISLQPFGAFVKALGVSSAAPLVMQDLGGGHAGQDARSCPAMAGAGRNDSATVSSFVGGGSPHRGGLTPQTTRGVSSRLYYRPLGTTGLRRTHGH